MTASANAHDNQQVSKSQFLDLRPKPTQEALMVKKDPNNSMFSFHDQTWSSLDSAVAWCIVLNELGIGDRQRSSHVGAQGSSFHPRTVVEKSDLVGDSDTRGKM